MHVYKEFTQPSAVTHSVACQLTGGGDEYLALVKGNSLLQIYSTKDVTVAFTDSESDLSEQDGHVEVETSDSFIGEEMGVKASKTRVQSKLVLVGEWPLDGFVTNIDKVNTLANDGDLLIITFKYAKSVLIGWDAENYTISTVSLHYYEKNLMEQHFFDQDFPSQLSVDPKNNCFCLMYQQDQLAFLPFLQKEEFDDAQANTTNSFYSSSILVSSSQFGEDIANIISVVFLHEYSEPTLAMIFQPQRTWTGTLPLYKDTVRYLVFALDLQNGSHTPIVSAQGLPYDTHTIVSLQEPIGGSLLIGVNQLLHIDSAGKICGVAVNGYSKLCTQTPLFDQSDLELRLEGSKVVPLTNSELLLITEPGAVYMVDFTIEGKKVYKISLKLLDRHLLPAPSTVASMKASRNVFVGSKTGEARLLSWKRKGEKTEGGKVSVEQSHKEDKDEHTFEDDEDEDLYGTVATETPQVSSGEEPIYVMVDDALPNYGPITSIAIGQPTVRTSHLSHPHPSSQGFDIVAASGSGITGALSVFQKSIKPRIFSDLKLPGCSELWTLNPRTRLQGDVSTDFGVPDTFLLTTDGETSKLYEIGKRLVDVTKRKASFISKAPTVGVTTICNGSAIVQVCPEKATIFDSSFGKPRSINFDSPASVASFADPYVLVLLQDGNYLILQASFDSKSGSPGLEKLCITTPSTVKCGALSFSTLFSDMKMTKRGVKRKRSGDDLSHLQDEEMEVPICIILTTDNSIEVSSPWFYSTFANSFL
ncbi:hypothetical protein TRICI_001682 [Trichomonascus ciferrii]|uniref:Uncharacterized protein n=1 Tax=Trichomonascus ciferrii TaxID=44093 RepID=A0A642V8Q2_9ASCO|nr:hypothetical protein TRICI_001682 [Trichomonascus ciferrii]